MLTAHIITVGDELLIGQIVNTNTAWIGDQLSQIGIACTRAVTVGDVSQDIQSAVAFARDHADVTIITGGLGPTHDDVTRNSVAEFFRKRLELDDGLAEEIAQKFARRGRRMAPSNSLQAYVPQGFEVIQNERGTAPGLSYRYDHQARERLLFITPGVPREMKNMMTNVVLPQLAERTGSSFLEHVTLQTAGIGESDLAHMLRDEIPPNGGEISLAFLPRLDGVRMRLTAKAATVTAAHALIENLETRIRAVAGKFVYGRGEVKIEESVGALLHSAGLSVAVAESCTGGLVASRITDVAGSSAYFLGSIVAYANEVKVRELGVAEVDLVESGAVSEPVVRQMAIGVKEKFGTEMGLASTGIMGPTGGTPDKPVGTVWLAVSGPSGTRSRRIQLIQDRQVNKLQASTALLDMTRRYLISNDSKQTD